MATSLQTFSFVLETKDLGDGKYEVKEISADLADPDADLHSSNRQTKNITLAFGLGVSTQEGPERLIAMLTVDSVLSTTTSMTRKSAVMARSLERNLETHSLPVSTPESKLVLIFSLRKGPSVYSSLTTVSS